jgi:hypothetical protein
MVAPSVLKDYVPRKWLKSKILDTTIDLLSSHPYSLVVSSRC